MSLFKIKPKTNSIDVAGCYTAIKGHCIAFQHNGAQEIARCMPRGTIKDVMTILFIGNTQQLQSLKPLIMAKREFQIRIDPIKQWLYFLKKVNALYYDIPIDFENFSETISSMQAELFESIELADDKSTAH